MKLGRTWSRFVLFVRFLSIMIFALHSQVASAAADGVVAGTSAGQPASGGKYGVLMSLGQAGPVGSASSSRYGLLAGYVPATLVPPDMVAPAAPMLTGGVQNQVFQVTAASLAALLGVSNPDGLDYQLRVSATIGELHQGGTSVATATLGQTDSVDWVPPTDQNGNINALSVVMQRGEYPDTGAVSVAVSVVAVNAPVNATPVAVGDSATLNEDTPFNLDVLANDTDQDNDALSVSSHAVPAHGSVATNNDGTLVYTPDPNFNGTDTFTYTVSDGNGGSDTGSVTLTVAAVNDPPVADAKSATTDAGNSVSITLSGADVDGGALSFVIATQPGNGSLTGSDASWQYTPANGFTGTDTFTYRISDTQLDSDSATVSITVNAVSASQQVTQSISLVQGWTLVSLYTQPANMTPSAVFSGHFDVIEEMRTLQGVFNTTWPDFLNTIQQLDLAGSYWIKSSTGRSDIQVTGTAPTSTVINLANGWNLIGFPSTGAQETATLFKPLSDNGVIERIIGTGEFYTFDSNALFNTLSSLKPGEGYWVKMSADDSLTVTSVTGSSGLGGRNLAKADGQSKLVELKEHLVTYPSVPAICITEIRANGRKAPAGSLLAAYVGDELRGVQEVRFQEGRMIVPVVVQSTQPAEVRFRLWHAGLGDWFEITERIEMDSGDALGMNGDAQIVLNVAIPWPPAPELALMHGPLRLVVRHELAKRYVVEQSSDLANWKQSWKATGNDQWQQIIIPTAAANKYFRVRALE